MGTFVSRLSYLLGFVAAVAASGCGDGKDEGSADSQAIDPQLDSNEGSEDDGDEESHDPNDLIPEEECPDVPSGFSATLCTCENLRVGGAFGIWASHSNRPAFLGVNGVTNLAGAVVIEGSAIPFSGFYAGSALDVHQTLATTRDLDVAGLSRIGGDLQIGQDLLGIGTLSVEGQLGLLGRARMLGLSRVGSYGTYQAPDQPCGCDPSDILDVAQVVQQAKTSNNNGSVGLPQVLDNIGVGSLRLPSGSYYVDALRDTGAFMLEIDGDVKLHVGSHVDLIGAHLLKLNPGAHLELWVAGTVHRVGHLVSGNLADPSAFRLYVGGEDAIEVTLGNDIFFGSIYAPRADLVYAGNAWIEGRVFAKSVHAAGVLNIRQSGATPDDEECPPPLD